MVYPSGDALASLREGAVRAVGEASTIGLALWQERAVGFTTKADGSPRAEGDLRIESVLYSRLSELAPWVGFLGEESGQIGARGIRWVVDPIDGTRDYLAGGIRWQILVALEVKGEPVLGIACVPAQNRLWWATRDEGTWTCVVDNGRFYSIIRNLPEVRDQGLPIRVARIPDEDPYGGPLDGRPTAHLELPIRNWRIHPALLVATGEAELGIQRAGRRWDYAALDAIVRYSGGNVSYHVNRRGVRRTISARWSRALAPPTTPGAV